jgi:hypothetical protein
MARDHNHGRRAVLRVGLVAFCVMMAVLKAIDPRFMLGGDQHRTPVSASLFWVVLGALILLTGHADAQLQSCQACPGAIRMAHAHQPAGSNTEPTEWCAEGPWPQWPAPFQPLSPPPCRSAS